MGPGKRLCKAAGAVAGNCPIASIAPYAGERRLKWACSRAGSLAADDSGRRNSNLPPRCGRGVLPAYERGSWLKGITVLETVGTLRHKRNVRFVRYLAVG